MKLSKVEKKELERLGCYCRVPFKFRCVLPCPKCNPIAYKKKIRKMINESD